MKPYSLFPHQGIEAPARFLRKGRYGTHITHFPSLKNSGVVVCESRLEADFALHQEFDRSVRGYYSQPITTEVMVGADLRSYTPDFRIVHSVGADRYWEVKPDSAAENPEFQALVGAVCMSQIGCGLTLHVAYASDIRVEPVLSNMKLLYARAHAIPERVLDLLRDRLCGAHAGLTWAEASHGGRLHPGVLGRLMVLGEAHIDLRIPFDKNSVVSTAAEAK